jgi:hypothetical protein
MNEAKILYNKKVKETGEEEGRRAMFSLLGHLAVGLFGIKHGVDTSGVKFDLTDWTAKYNQLYQAHKIDMDTAKTEYDAREDRRKQILDAIKEARRDLERQSETMAREETDRSRFTAEKEFQLAMKKAELGRRDIEKEEKATEKKETQSEKQWLTRERTKAALINKTLMNVDDAFNARVKGVPSEKAAAGELSVKASSIGADDYETWKKSNGYWRDYYDEYVDYMKIKRNEFRNKNEKYITGTYVDEYTPPASGASTTETPETQISKARVVEMLKQRNAKDPENPWTLEDAIRFFESQGRKVID